MKPDKPGARRILKFLQPRVGKLDQSEKASKDP
jgi:hypothetical protein